MTRVAIASPFYNPTLRSYLISWRAAERKIDCKRKIEGMFSMEASMAKRLSVLHSDPEILGGTPVFVGTRVPLRNLFDYLERGHDIDEFLDAFSSVSRDRRSLFSRTPTRF